MNFPKFVFVGALVACTFTLPGAAASAAVDEKPAQTQKKKLIEFGWDEPDAGFLRKHADAMERNAPFDGCVFHAAWSRAEGSSAPGKASGNFTWECWSARAFTHAELAQSLADLKAAPLKRMRHNFLRFNVTPGDVDWFDDSAFGAVVNNARLAAKLAHDGGACDGVLFDIEQYDKKLFRYPAQKLAADKSWDDYAARVRQRGGQVMAAFQEGYPDLVVMLTFAYSLPHAQAGGEKAKLAKVDYGLLAPLLDGMVEAAAGKSKIVDGFELSYGYRDPAQFERAYETMRTGVLPLVDSDHGKFRQVMSFGFGLWLDYDWRKKGWDEKDASRNYFTPEGFRHSAGAALQKADDYVWVYTETPRWWTEPDGLPAKLPEAYRQALQTLPGTTR